MLVNLRLTETMRRAYVHVQVYLMFTIFALLAAYQLAKGQESLQLSTLERQKPGVAEGIPNDALPPSEAPSINELSAPLIGLALVSLFNDSVPRTRGAQDISLFRNVAPSVVLIWTKDSALGSGSLLKDNTILTNRHVVGDERQVTVIFKPPDPSGKAKADEVVQAHVIKLDAQRDLALVRPASISSRRPLDISAEDSIDVGTNVAAGHPSGKTWTFTKGIVSAFRPAFQWSGGPNDSKHVATLRAARRMICCEEKPGPHHGPCSLAAELGPRAVRGGIPRERDRRDRPADSHG
jgi:S1-C subfamily serine protease